MIKFDLNLFKITRQIHFLRNFLLKSNQYLFDENIEILRKNNEYKKDTFLYFNKNHFYYVISIFNFIKVTLSYIELLQNGATTDYGRIFEKKSAVQADKYF